MQWALGLRTLADFFEAGIGGEMDHTVYAILGIEGDGSCRGEAEEGEGG